jgi:hypothetical protein
VLTPELICGPVSEAGVCRERTVVTCGPNGFSTTDCAAAGLDCVLDDQGSAGCACACDTGAACQPDCPCAPPCACTETKSGGCAVARGSASPACAALLAFVLLLAVRRQRGVVVALVGLLALHGCSGSTKSECVRIEDGGTTDGVAGPDAQADAPPASACQTLADLLNPDACGPGWACDIVDAQFWYIGCRLAGTTAPYAPCVPPAPACVAGTTCATVATQIASSSCMPHCDLNAATPSCPESGLCVFSWNTSAGAIGLCAVPLDCDPMAADSCGDGNACVLLDEARGAFFCQGSGSLAPGTTCTLPSACTAGYGCLGDPASCLKWCHTMDDCPAPATCTHVGEIPNHADLGYCG